MRGAAIAFATAAAFDFVGTVTTGHRVPDFMSPAHVANMAGHALVGCGSAVAQGGRCGPGALSAAAGSFAGPILRDLGFQRNLVAHAVVGGLASVAGGGNFANGAVTAAFGYLFNECAHGGCANGGYDDPAVPGAPPGVDLARNIALVESMRDYYTSGVSLTDIAEFAMWFYNQVRPGGPWDFKAHYGPKYEDFGNYHYGAAAAATGIFTEFQIYNEAGIAQTVRPPGGSWGYPASRWSYIFGFPSGKYPYGDDPWDRSWISRGIRDYRGK